MERDIKKIETRMFQVPLDEVLADAKHGDHYFFELVTVTITLADGSREPAIPIQEERRTFNKSNDRL